MKKFADLPAFVTHLKKLNNQFLPLRQAALEQIGQYIQIQARNKFGVYQAGQEPYEAWAPLKEATQRQRVCLGYTPDDPLYRSGALRDSISYFVLANKLVLGSTADIMIYHELGTEHIPPRSVLGLTLVESHEKLRSMLKDVLLAWLLGNPVCQESAHD